ncbi:MAG: TlpA disulfide reductase family protein [Verrucomicrobiota bacterium]
MQNPKAKAGWQHWLSVAVCGWALMLPAQTPAPTDDPILAWEAFQAVARKLPAPAIWKARPPTPEEREEFKQKQLTALEKSAGLAREFYTRFPKDPNAGRARKKEWEALSMLLQAGQSNRLSQLETVETALLADTNLDDEDRFEIRSQATSRQVMARRSTNLAQTLEDYEKGARQMLKEFPDRTEPYETLLLVADNSPREKALKLTSEIAAAPKVSDRTKQAALELMQRLELIGTRPGFKLTTATGEVIDLAKPRGKPVVLSFWATWCPACMMEMPALMELQAKYASQGVEFIGINQDRDKDAFLRYLKDKEITWPQCYDAGQELATQLRVTAIPVCYMLDKKGILREILVGKANLEKPLQALLKE